MKNSQITIANTPAQIRRCHPVMRQLRPLFQDPEHFVERVLRQQKKDTCWRFLNLTEKSAPLPAIDSSNRSSPENFFTSTTWSRVKVTGRAVLVASCFDWLIKQAREHDCENLELDSGVERFDAHRFYLLKRMNISSYHFRIRIESND